MTKKNITKKNMTIKKWYDYLWVVSLTYLILGFFNILFAWLGLLCFFIPLLIAVAKGNKAYCNKYCGRGQLFSLVGGRFGLSRRKDMPVLPLWISDLFLRNVFPHAVEHLAGIRRRQGSRHGRDTAVDVQAPVALGLSRHPVFRRRRTVCLWLLQCDAHIHRAGIPYHGLIQTPLLVRVLSYGHDDTADLPGKEVLVPLAGQFPEALSVQDRNASP